MLLCFPHPVGFINAVFFVLHWMIGAALPAGKGGWMSVPTSTGMAALDSTDPTGQISYGAALLSTSRFTTPHARCQSRRQAHGRLPRGLKRVMQTPGCGSRKAM